MLVDKTKEEGFFGERQALLSRIFFFFYQAIFFVCVGLVAVAVFTMHLEIIAILGVISLVSIPVGRCQAYIDFVNKYIQPLKYFNHFEIIYEQLIPEEEKCLFGVHPHSVFGLGLLASMNSSSRGQLANMVGLGSRFILNFPVVGLILKLWGVRAVNPANVKRLMREGKSIGLLPGGFEQATITSQHELRCYIENRKGFVKYAVDNDYVIYPVLVLGEHQAFLTFEPWLKFRLFLNKLKFPGIFFWNKYTGLFMPPWLDLHVIVGAGIRTADFKARNLSGQELIDETHRAYVNEIERIYLKHAHLNSEKPLRFY